MTKYQRPLLDLDGTVRHDNGDWVEAGTIFVEDDLGIAGRPAMSAIYLPKAFRADPQVDVLLYLHGFTQQPSIQTYLRSYKLRQIVEASAKNVIFIAPTLGKRAEPGNLVNAGAAMDYLNRMMTHVRTFGPYPSDGPAPSIRNIVLAAHSGGGYSMMQIAGDLQESGQNKECWGFDCLYVPSKEQPLAAPYPYTWKESGHPVADDLDSWRDTIKQKPEGFWVDWCRAGNSVRLFWGNGGTLTRTANCHLYSLLPPSSPGVEVEPAFYDAYPSIAKKTLMPAPAAQHDAVPRTVLGKCLASAGTLS
jgi:hypothetical protein